MKTKGKVKGSLVVLPPNCSLSDGAEVLVSPIEAHHGEVSSKFGIVAFFDILGFSQAMESVPIPDLVQAIRSNRDLAHHEIRSGMRHSGQQCEIVTISDSVLIAMELPDHNPGDTQDRLLSFLDSTCWFFTGMFRAGWPLRGGIAVGDYCMVPDELIIAGRVIVEARNLEAKQEWCGCSLTKAAARTVGKYHSFGGWLVSHRVPVKYEDSTPRNLAVLDWRKTLRTSLRLPADVSLPCDTLDDFVLGRFQANGKSALDDKVKRMCDHTLCFLKKDEELTSQWAAWAAGSSSAPA